MVVNLNIISANLISYLSVQVRPDGSSAAVPGLTQQVTNPGANFSVPINLAYPPMERGQKYTVAVWAYDQNSHVIGQQVVSSPFTSAPLPPTPVIKIWRIHHTPQTRPVTLELQSYGAENVATMQLDIFQVDTNTAILNKPTIIQGVPEFYDLPSDVLALLSDGTKYSIRLTPLDATNNVLAPPIEDTFVYTPPQPGIVDQVSQIFSSPLVLALLLVLAILIGLGLIRRRRKKHTEPPVVNVNDFLNIPATRLVPPPSRSPQSLDPLATGETTAVVENNFIRKPSMGTEIAPNLDGQKRTKLRAYITVKSARTLDENQTFRRRHRMDRQVFKVGRNNTGDLNLDFDLDISRPHFTITFDEANRVFTLQDVSRAGTVVNGVMVHQNSLELPVDQPTDIEIGYMVRLKFEPQLENAARRGASE